MQKAFRTLLLPRFSVRPLRVLAAPMSTVAAEAPAFRHLHKPLGAERRERRIVIIGAGIAGIHAVKKWKDEANVVVQCYEREDAIGGVWQHNYPGLYCDFAAHVFQYSWAPNPRWSQFFASRDEILQYLNDTVDEHGLRQHIKTGHSCAGAVWDDEASQWRLQIQQRGRDGSATTFEDSADIVLVAWGHLDNYKWPDIPGLQSFKGKVMHSARWDFDYDLTGKRVACMGNGASAVQIVPAIHSKLKALDIYMRTPAWITPSPLPGGVANMDYTMEQIEEFQRDPQKLFDSIKVQENTFQARMALFRKGSGAQKGSRAAMEGLYKKLFADHEELRQKITPDFAFGCRRPTPGLGFLKTMLQENVRVFDEAIQEITPTGIRAGGQETEYDAIICATGYNSTYRPRFDIIGRDGVNLVDLWEDHPELYMGATVHGYPNLAWIVGPGSPLGNHFNAVELSCRYIGLLINRLVDRDLLSWDVSKAAQDDWQEYFQARHKELVYSESCRSWYKTESGHVYLPYIGTVPHYARATATVQEGDYVFKRSSRNRFDWLGDGQLPEEAAADLTGVDLTPFLGNKAGVAIDDVPVPSRWS